MKKRIGTGLLAALCAGLLTAAVWAVPPGEASSATLSLDIPSQSLNDALQTLALASRHKLLYSSELVDGKRSPAIKGKFTTEEAVKRLLVWTDLKYEVTGDGLVLIRAADASAATGRKAVEKESKDPPKEGKSDSSQDFPVDQVVQGVPETQTGNVLKEQQNKKGGLEEIVVTGTHIRAAEATTSQIIQIGGTEITQSGATTTADLLRLLPQNTGSGQNAYNNFVTGNAFENGGNPGSITSVNLRGLGSSATLILIDGHRLAPSGLAGAVDVSAIPLNAIERVEILTDGASAAYGSDAVGGVVNFILKKEYDGARTEASYGFTADGGGQESRFSQALGKRWDSGHILLSYDYGDRKPIYTNQRSYSASVDPPATLAPSSVSNSVFLTAEQTLNRSNEIFAQAFYTHRGAFNLSGYPAGQMDPIAPVSIYSSSRENQFGITAGLRTEFQENWQSRITATFASDQVRQDITQVDAGSTFAADEGFINSIAEVEDVVDGSVATVPAGDLKVALGAGYRNLHPKIGLASQDQRDTYGFVEASIPLISGDMRVPAIHSLNLSLEARQDHYNTFGSATSPRVGLAYSPIPRLTFRSSWGKGFRTPQPFELYGPTTAYLYEVPPGAAPNAPFGAVLVTGGSPNLEPERSKSFTFGAEIKSESAPTWSVSTNYYNIDFSNRIVQPSPDLFQIYSDPAFSTRITHNPTPARVQDTVNSAGAFLDLTGGTTPLGDVTAIADARDYNAATLRTSGLDILANQTHAIGSTQLGWQANVNKVFRYELQSYAGGSFISQLDRIYYIPSLKGRAGITLTRGPWGGAVFGNYTHGYLNNSTINSVPVNQEVGSWTTFDGQLSYTLPKDAAGVLRGAAVRLSVEDIANKAPPYAQQFIPIGYDTTNADPRGRTIIVSVVREW